MDKAEKEMLKAFRALADETRQRIMELLCEVEMSVTDICEEFETTQPTISHHLQILKNCDLLETKRRGKMIYYYINKEVVQDVFGNVLERFHIKVKSSPSY
jgi:DNA-binding transcriptional ArsR family regulator